MTEIMFDNFNVPSLFISISAVLALYSSGRTTGIVVDSGSGVTNTVPIYEGYQLPHAIMRMNLAGTDLTQYLQVMLAKLGINFSRETEFEVVKDIKEKLSYIAIDYAEEEKVYTETSTMDKIYQLPDGSNITISQQRFRCPEALF
jgi:actin